MGSSFDERDEKKQQTHQPKKKYKRTKTSNIAKMSEKLLLLIQFMQNVFMQKMYTVKEQRRKRHNLTVNQRFIVQVNEVK